MSRFEGGLTSFFPRPEELIAATREWERGRRPRAELDALFTNWTEQVSALETSMGLSWVTGGHLAWQDLFRPFIESSEGLTTGPLTRWFETNTFFRRPVIEGVPKLRPGALSQLLRGSKKGLTVILPGPWTFLGLSENRSSVDSRDVASALSTLLAAGIEELRSAGASQFVLHEPLAVVAPPHGPAEEARFLELYRPLGNALASTPNLLWTYFGDGAAALPLLSKLPVQGIGVDLSDTRPSDIRSFDGAKSLGLGCLDARTSLPEDPEEIASLARELNARLAPKSVVLGPGVPIDLLPWDAAKLKLQVLPQALKLLAGGR